MQRSRHCLRQPPQQQRQQTTAQYHLGATSSAWFTPLPEPPLCEGPREEPSMLSVRPAQAETKRMTKYENTKILHTCRVSTLMGIGYIRVSGVSSIKYSGVLEVCASDDGCSSILEGYPRVYPSLGYTHSNPWNFSLAETLYLVIVEKSTATKTH